MRLTLSLILFSCALALGTATLTGMGPGLFMALVLIPLSLFVGPLFDRPRLPPPPKERKRRGLLRSGKASTSTAGAPIAIPTHEE